MRLISAIAFEALVVLCIMSPGRAAPKDTPGQTGQSAPIAVANDAAGSGNTPYGGIGISPKAVAFDNQSRPVGPLRVAEVCTGAPAEAAGLEVDGVPIGGMPFDSIIAHIRGEVGTSVALQVTYAGARKSITKTLTREKITTAQAAPADTAKSPR